MSAEEDVPAKSEVDETAEDEPVKEEESTATFEPVVSIICLDGAGVHCRGFYRGMSTC